MRKPNGYGSIKKLSGNRRRPFAFVISENGRQKPVAYFTNQIDAEIFKLITTRFIVIVPFPDTKSLCPNCTTAGCLHM